MAQVVKLKRTAVSGKVPSTSNLELGELAINTYDGKIYFEKDSGTPSIESILTTNSTTTGSINLIGSVTASYFTGDGSNLTFGGTEIVSSSQQITSYGFISASFIDSLNTFTQSAITVTGNGTSGSLSVFSDTHTVVNSNITTTTESTTIVHGNDGNIIFTVSGSNGELLTVTDSNSGNLLEVNDTSGIDVFTVSAVGDVSASGAITASGFNLQNDFSANGNITATGNISGSSFNGTGLISGSSQLTSSYDTRYVISGSLTQTTWNNISGKPSGILSASAEGSSQGQISLNGNDVNINSLGTDDSPQFTNLTLSGNLTVQGTTTTVDSSNINISGSLLKLNYGGGAVNGGLEVTDATSTLATGSLLWDGTNDYWKGGIKGSEIKLLRENGDGVVSGSSQIIDVIGSLNTYTSSQDNINTLYNSYTSSTDIRLNGIDTTTASFDGRLDNLESTTSSFDGRLDNLESVSGSFATTGSNSFSGDQTITGDLSASGEVRIGEYIRKIGDGDYPYIRLMTNETRFGNQNVENVIFGAQGIRIGADAPSGNQLEVYGTGRFSGTNPGITISSDDTTGTNELQIEWLVYPTSQPDTKMFNDQGGNFIIYHNERPYTTERFKIDSSGAITFNEAYKFPTSDGTNGQILQTNGSGVLSFGTISGYTDSDNTDHLNSLGVISGSSQLVFNDISASGALTASELRIDEYIRKTDDGDYPFIRLMTNEIRFGNVNTENVIFGTQGIRIGADAPSGNQLEVDGVGRFSGTNPGIVISSDDTTGNNELQLEWLVYPTGQPDSKIVNDQGGNFIIYHNERPYSTERFKIDSSGAITFNEAYKFPTTDGSANQVLQTDGNGVLSFGTVSGYTDSDNTDHLNSLGVISGSSQIVSSLLNQTVNFGTGEITASYFSGDGSGLTNVNATISENATVTSSFDNLSTISVGHNFDTKNVIVSVYNDNDSLILPQEVNLTDANNLEVVLSSATSGFVVVAKGGHVVSGSAGDATNLNGQTADYYLNYNNFTNTPSGLVSGSSQISELGYATTGSNTFEGAINITRSKGQLSLTDSDNDRKYLIHVNEDAFYLNEYGTSNKIFRVVTGSLDHSILVEQDGVTIGNDLLVNGNISGSSFNGTGLVSSSYALSLTGSDATTWDIPHGEQIRFTSQTGLVVSLNESNNDITWALDENIGSNSYFQDGVKSKLNTEGVLSGSVQITDLTTYKETVSGNSSYTITHNLNEQYPIVQAWNTGTSQQELPQTITTNSANQVSVEFATTFAGVIIVKK